MLGTATVGNRARKGEENQVAAGHEGRRQAALGDLNGHIARERRFRNPTERVDFDHMVLAEPRCPIRAQVRHTLAHARPYLKLDRIALAIGEADRLDADESLECPGKADRRIQTAGKKDECRLQGNIHDLGVHGTMGPMQWVFEYAFYATLRMISTLHQACSSQLILRRRVPLERDRQRPAARLLARLAKSSPSI